MTKRLTAYTPSTTSPDDTVSFLEVVFKHLPVDGKLNLASDISDCETDSELRQLVTSIETGLLLPMRASGGQSAAITPSPRWGFQDSVENLAAQDFESQTRHAQQRLRAECLRRDGGCCIVTGASDYRNPTTPITGELEAAHILPFSLASYGNEIERTESCQIWTNIFRYFPSLRSRLNFTCVNINDHTNVMMLDAAIHRQFGRFALSLAATSEMNVYTIETFKGFATIHAHALPVDRRVTLTSHDGRYELPSPILLEIHNSISHILHLTGRGEMADKIKEEYDAAPSLAPGGESNVLALLSVSNLALRAE
ncbi:hypothetical protein ASPBRDRAFT_667000 [Aspergillus brasiliensis CBS 101740]|uniref:HNH nuclease domain-containing protein n=1 Tax=Aspergillus brasiliensis (strain CBS 101740 / IMI 381727 / IBT 21946) TaxID=767769 RepID=A0A1L9U2W0_ASPBC|nr:hypothetical protein ASPBRDRAFT_667000 [Aspergillus brasiliensis CBS 101740]